MSLPFPYRAVPAVLAGALTALLAACTPSAAAGAAVPASVPAATPPAVVTPAAAPAPAPAAPAPVVSTLSIPAAGVTGLRVVPYEGTTDDVAGTRIQDLGAAASPYGKQGGVGPGQVGNFLVTAHRMSAGGPLGDLPAVGPGDTVLVTVGEVVYTYEITTTRKTSFRSERSLSEQRAAVPGAPGAAPTQAMITISTCATPEDHAQGNFWKDAQGNPEHRIDKIGVLRTTSAAVPAG
ncbi:MULTISPECIES: sortase domain-containing protein [unclassified Streptomyces]|uniref:sortase domain-containing protein n=1 Tax=unclassified Streptomyces TaxID=2593676 RepID=UPI002E11AD68|nr:sortase [Streptomyces sp. NBC_01207]WTA23173.1 sortase [Streptomyces sp. NBC_00853]